MTLILAEIFLFYRLYNEHFEIYANEQENPYILLKNGKYFEMECKNDVIDNRVDFSQKPFENGVLERELENRIIRHKHMCSDGADNMRITEIDKKRNSLRIVHNISTNIESSKEDVFYYTQLDYPIVPEINEEEDHIKIYDSNCTITIPKRVGYKYIVRDQSLRIGTKLAQDMEIEIDLQIKCL